MSWQIYLGPYFECVRRPVEVVREERVCPLKSHPFRYISADYCAQCGVALVTRTSTTTTYESLFERVGEQLMDLDGSTADGPTICMAPNVQRPGWTWHTPFGGPPVPLRIAVSSFEIDGACTWLDDAFAFERHTLEAACVSVETKWGFHRWWS